MPKDNLIERLRELLAGATSRPWLCAGAICHLKPNDQLLVVEAVNALPDLLDEIARLKGENERLQGKMRMIVSHATGGSSSDITASTNDICVLISQMRNHIYQDGKDRGAAANQALIEEMVEGLDEAIQALAAAGSKYRDASLDVAALRARTLIAKATKRATLTPAAPAPPPDESPRPGC